MGFDGSVGKLPAFELLHHDAGSHDGSEDIRGDGGHHDARSVEEIQGVQFRLLDFLNPMVRLPLLQDTQPKKGNHGYSLR